MLGWNSMSLAQYLKVTYKFAAGAFTDQNFKDLVLLHLCKNHWIKMVSTDCKNYSI